MKNYALLLLTIAMIFSSCTDDCQTYIDDVGVARQKYNTNPVEANCISYRQALDKYLNSDCGKRDDIDYPTIFSDFRAPLNCDDIVLPTCNDGILNGNETGIDCGGDCSACDNPDSFFINFDLDGVNYYNKATIDIADASCCLNGFASSSSEANYERFISINFDQTLTIELSDFQSALNVSYSLDTAVSPVNSYLTFTIGTDDYSTQDAGNTNANSLFKVTSVAIYSQPGASVTTYLVEGIFNGSVKKNNAATQSLSNGSFRLIFGGL